MILNSGAEIRATIVGSEKDSFVPDAITLLRGYKINFGLCQDIYAAAGSLAKSYAANILIIGQLKELGKQNGQFFDIAGGNNYLCCCFVGGQNTQSQISRAKKAGVTLITKTEELEEIISTIATGKQSSQMKTGNNKVNKFSKEDFSPSAAELDALLGI